MSVQRPLPPKPSLEFEHKEAKALLRQLRAGDPDALARARARHPAIEASTPARIRLADAQLVIAREYGFTSWPRLARYFAAAERQRHSPPQTDWTEREPFDASVQSLLAGHRNRRASVARSLASYVPKLYGMRAADVFAATITEDDARLVVAREHGASSWETLLERLATAPRGRENGWEYDPMKYAGDAMRAGDLAELQRVIERHPDLVHPSDYDWSHGRNLLAFAIHHERRQGVEAMRPIVEWLATLGLDHQLELNRQLCGHMRMSTDKVRWLLERGADPNWVAPNRIPVLEHALIKYWNGEAVDLVAARAVPRKALWIAAGLGDVDGVRRSLDEHGKPIPAAVRLRPDFDALGSGVPSHPDPDDEELLMEAFFVAMLNGRSGVLEYMVSRGTPIDSRIWGSPVIHVAIGNRITPMVECLVRCGANLDVPGNLRGSSESGRDIARETLEMFPDDADRRRIAELCGLDPDVILAELKGRRTDPPRVAPKLQEALELAGDDAFRLGQAEIGPENLLFGLLRGGGLPVGYFTKVSGMDLDRFRSDVSDRVRPVDDRVERPKIPLNPEAQATIQAAIASAAERRREMVHGLHLLYALTRTEDGPAGEWLARYGSSAAAVNPKVERAM